LGGASGQFIGSVSAGHWHYLKVVAALKAHALRIGGAESTISSFGF